MASVVHGVFVSSLAVEVDGGTCRMRGNEPVPIRCVALTGRVGEQVACSIYERRPSPCREFEAGDYACNKARTRHGLPPLQKGLVL